MIGGFEADLNLNSRDNQFGLNLFKKSFVDDKEYESYDVKAATLALKIVDCGFVTGDISGNG